MAANTLTRRNVFIIGAQCTGKTTLVNELEQSFAASDLATAQAPSRSPVIIREVARTILREKNFSRQDITLSKARALQLQQHILDAQVDAERTASLTGSWYVCDRSGLDPIVYARTFVGQKAADEILESEQWKQLEQRMQTGVVILCEAGCCWLIDDGTRLMPSGLEDWMRMDATFRELLQMKGISYTVVPKELTSLEERVQLVKAAIEARGT